ncbi:MAG: DUF2612 domain-containing protein [Proteobacteria bacterium]|nr:DUF2612 domain-containing protein [Pseudomonadota bacterium]
MDVNQDLLDRLFSQFRNSPNILNLLTILADPLQDSIDVSDWILSKNSIDDAEGEQLEQLASIIGVSRPPAQEPRIAIMYEYGECDDPDNDHGFYNDDDSVETGGRMINDDGLAALDGSQMSDTDFRFLIRQRAASFRTKMTRANLFNYLLAFNCRCKIDDDTEHVVSLTPVTYQQLNSWAQNYIEDRGFKPAGVSVDFIANLTDKVSI